LGLEDTIIPSRTIGRYLADMVEGLDILELSTVIRGEARFYTFTARKEDAKAISDLALPENAKVVCLYRGDQFILADQKTKLREKDEVVILTHSENLPSLRDRWEPKNNSQ
jgi:trk system potassium uptake protein TrkA